MTKIIGESNDGERHTIDFELKDGRKLKFINESGLKFKNISSEFFREYELFGGNIVTIENPLLLNVSESGGHRVFDATGYSWYVQPAEGWSICWNVKEGEPNFSL